MAKVDFRRLSKNEHESLHRELDDVFFGLQKSGHLQLFLSDLLTTSERVMMARRIRIAKHLLCGVSQLEISNLLHVGLTTVERVDRWLRTGCENYRKIFPPLSKITSSQRREPTFKYTFADLRRRYPQHYLLFNLLIDFGK